MGNNNNNNSKFIGQIATYRIDKILQISQFFKYMKWIDQNEKNVTELLSYL